MTARKAAWWVLGLELVALAAMIAVPIFAYEKPTIHTDESYHLICSRSINAGQGLPVIGEAPYVRAWVFSYAVAYAQGMFGDSLTAARLPAIASAIVLVLAVFTWVRLRSGRLAAWLAALLLGLAIHTLDIAQFCRFYSMHALVVFVMNVAAYEALQPQHPRLARAVWALLALALVPLGYHLQESTIVAVLALGVWLGLVILWTLWTTPRLSGRGKLIGLGVIALAAIAVFVLVATTSVGQRAVFKFTWSPRWRDPAATVWYYHQRLFMPWYWTWWCFTPIALIAALTRYVRLTVFAATLFAASLIIMSLSKVHAPRYFYFALPMICVIWGVGAAVILVPLHAWLARCGQRWLSRRGAAPQLARAWTVAAAVVLALLVAYGFHRTPGYWHTLRVLRTSGPDAITVWGDYAAAVAALRRDRPEVLDVPVVLAAPVAKAAYYFPDRQYLLLGKADYGDIHRMIPDPERLHEVMAQYPRGLIVIDDRGGYWRNPGLVSPTLADAIEAAATPAPLPDNLGVRVFTWGIE